jgi:pilus assembly protein CpaF
MAMLARFPVGTDIVPKPKSNGLPQPPIGPLSEVTSQTIPPEVFPTALRSNSVMSDKLLDAKVRLHQRLLEEINLSALEKLSEEETRRHVSELVAQYILDDNLSLNSQEFEEFLTEVLHEMTGLGSIEPLLKDPTVGDIMINGHDCVYVERRGVLEQTAVRFSNDAHLLRIINKIVSAVGRRVDESQPLCDARLADGSRVNVVLRPVALNGPVVSIRKFPAKPYNLHRLIAAGALSSTIAQLLSAAVCNRISLIVSGGTGSGKTTLLNALSGSISERERLVTIEDAAEFQFQQPHVIRLETRPPNLEGKGGITQRELVRNALRMRPDRIILGECRGEEAFDMLQAMNTGHEGSMTTIHANTPRDVISRLEQMVGMSGIPATVGSIRAQIASAVRVIVQLQRFADGKRRVTSVSEITGLEGNTILMQEIYRFVRDPIGQDGSIDGHFEATGIRPRFLPDLIMNGAKIPDSFFDPAFRHDHATVSGKPEARNGILSFEGKHV